MEWILLGTIISQMKHMIVKSQHRFTKGRTNLQKQICSLCQSNLLGWWWGLPMDIVYLDSSKAFDTVSHGLLLEKPVLVWTSDVCSGWETGWEAAHRVVVNSSFSNWQPATSGVCQGSKLAPTLFTIFISDLNNGIKCILVKFDNDTKPVGKWTLWKVALQEDLDRLGEWADKNLMKFNQDKCQILHLGKYSRVQHRLGPTCLWSSSVERDLWVLGIQAQCKWVVLLGHREPAGHWAASTRASPQRHRSHCPTQSLSGHTWNTMLSLGSHYSKGCGQAGKPLLT